MGGEGVWVEICVAGVSWFCDACKNSGQIEAELKFSAAGVSLLRHTRKGGG